MENVDGDELEDADWAAVLDGWDEQTTHDAYVSRALADGRLGEAAGRYRVFLDDPARSEVARKRLGTIAFLAEQSLVAARRPLDTTRLRRVVLVMAVAVCAGLLALLYVAMRGP